MPRRPSGFLFALFAFVVAGLAFIPNPGWFAGTFVGWLVFGVLLVAGQLAMVSFAGTLPVVSAVILSALVIGSEYGLPLETGLPMLAIAAVLASQAALPDGKWFPRLLALVVTGWLFYAVWGWWTLGISPAESRWGFIKFFSPDWPGECAWPRLEWPLGNANPMAGLLLMLIPLGVALTIAEAKAKLWRMPWAVATLLAVGLLAACGSRAGLLAPVIAGFAYLVMLPSLRLRTGIKVAVGGVALAALGVFIALSPVYRQRILNPESQTYSDQIRRDFAETGLNMIKANPLSGVGAGGVPAHYAPYLSASSDQPGCHQLHCTPLQWAAEFGLFGGLLWIGLAVITLLALRRAACSTESRVSRGGAAVAATAYLVFSLLDYQLYLPVTACVWGLCIGLAWRGTAFPPLREKLRTGMIFAIGGVSVFTAWRVFEGSVSRFHSRQAGKLLAANDVSGALDQLGLAMRADSQSAVYPAVAATWIATLPTDDAKAAAQNRTMADALFIQARKNAPDFPYLTALNGWLWVDADPAKAVALFHEALRISPKLPAAWQGLARAYARQGHQDAAVTALALNGMIVSEDLFSPSIRTGFFKGAAPRVLARFRQLSESYRQDFSQDIIGIERLSRVRRQVDAWGKSGDNVVLFLRQNPDWSEAPLWRHLASVEMKKDATGVYPPRSRMIMTSALHSVTGIEGKDGHAQSLLNACNRITDAGEFAGTAILTAQETFQGLGLYLGDASLPPRPLYAAEADPLALLYLYEGDPVRTHLRASFFAKARESLLFLK